MTAARIVTLTPNAALDLWTATPRVLPGPKLRCAAPAEDPGGGGINVSRAVARLGGETLAIYAAGGLSGEAVGAALRREAVPAVHVPTAGPTRQSFSVQEETTGAVYRFVTPGPALAEDEVAALLAALDRALAGESGRGSDGGPGQGSGQGSGRGSDGARAGALGGVLGGVPDGPPAGSADRTPGGAPGRGRSGAPIVAGSGAPIVAGSGAPIVVGSGSLPPGVPATFWADCAARARAAGARFVLDTGTGAAEALAVGVTVFRENADVIARIAGRSLAWPGGVADWAGARVAAGAAEIVIATEGAQGALMVTRDAALLLAPPRVVTRSAIGAGDSFVAGFCHALASGSTPPEALRLAVATAAATMLSPGTALCAREDVLRLLDEVGTPMPI